MKTSCIQAIVAVLFAVAILNPAPACADTITLAADQWCPYTCSPRSDKPGYLIEIAKVIFAKHGHTIEYIVLPWARAVAETEMGKYNAVAGAIREDAPNFIFPAIENGFSQDSFYSRNGYQLYTGPDSLDWHKVGTARGYSYGQFTDALLSSPNIKLVPESGCTPIKKNIAKLERSRLDYLIADEAVMAYNLSEMNLSDLIKPVGSPEPGEGMYIAFSPLKVTSRQYARILSEGMEQIRESGELHQILSKYGLKDWR